MPPRQAAIQALHETEVDGRSLKVTEAKPREDRPRGGGMAAAAVAVVDAAVAAAVVAVEIATAGNNRPDHSPPDPSVFCCSPRNLAGSRCSTEPPGPTCPLGRVRDGS